jgi:hypothetical protein
MLVPRPGYLSAATATLGRTVVGSQVDSGDSNEINGGRFATGAAAGTVSSMSVFVASVDAAPNNLFQLAIYSDSNGLPGALIASTASGTLTANAWNTLPLTAPLSANTPYWLMYNTNGRTRASNDMGFDGGGTDAWSIGAVPFGAWPASFGPAATGSQLFSIYATYDTGSTPTATATFAASATPTQAFTATPTGVPPTATPSATATTTAQLGSWGPLIKTPTVLVNAQVMPGGKVLVWGLGGNAAYVYDLASGSFTPVPINLDLVCAAQSFLPDGSPFIVGGGGITGIGIANAERFDAPTNRWVPLAPMSIPRWYPTLTSLPDGRSLVTSGHISSPADVVGTPEIYDPSANTWTALPKAQNAMPVYPFMYVLSDGRVLHAGGSEAATGTEALDLATQMWTTVDRRWSTVAPRSCTCPTRS